MSRDAPVFDQRGQTVAYQYNAAGNINVGGVQNVADFINQMRFLRNEADKAAKSGVLTNDQSIDVIYNIDKSENELEKPNPNKNNIIDYRAMAKNIVNGVSAAAGLTEALSQCVEKVQCLI